MKELKAESKKSLFIFVFIIIGLGIIIAASYAAGARLPSKGIVTNILRLDEDAYGNNVFDSSNLDFKVILDKEVSQDSNHVIYIDFRVGGSNLNSIDNIVYDIALVDLEIDCSLLSPYLKWNLFKNGELVSEGSFDYQFDTITNKRLVLTPIQQDLVAYSEDKSEYDYYEFYMWLSESCQSEDLTECLGSEDQSELAGKQIKGKIEVELYAETKKALVRNPSEELDTNTCISDNHLTEEETVE